MAEDLGAVRERIEGPLAERGLLIEELKAPPAGRHRRLIIILDLAGDTADPVSSEHIADATRLISELIDDMPLFNDRPYDLEVSSPGALRPLTEARHFSRVRGRRIEAATAEGKVTGFVVSASADAVVLDVDGDERTLPLAEIESAQVVLSFR